MMKSKDKSWAEQVWVRWMVVLAVLLIATGSQAMAERSALTNPLVPVIEGDYVHIYQPQGDVFSGPDTRDLKAGQFYPSWQPNDHCFVKGPDGHWHAFGITHPESQPGQSRHQGEFVSFHAVSPGKTFESSLKTDSWADKPKVLPPAQRPGESPANHAPTIVKHDGVYKMIYGPCPFRMAVSEDLYAWTPKGPVGIEERSGRDPSLFLWNDTYILVYCAGNVVKAATSKNLADWSEPVEIFRGEEPTYQCESPTLIFHEGLFYLFWCLWDTANKNGNGYDERSFVYCSDNPLDFHGHPRIAELKTHAPEIFQDEEHNWYISSAQYPAAGSACRAWPGRARRQLPQRPTPCASVLQSPCPAWANGSWFACTLMTPWTKMSGSRFPMAAS